MIFDSCTDLHLIDIHTVSKASILGSTELFVKKGSDINLTCVTFADEDSDDDHLPVPSAANRTPLHFAWLHNGQVNEFSIYIA